MQFVNYSRNETTNERFARGNRAASELDTAGSFVTSDSEALLGGGHKTKRTSKKGCWFNCKMMCCNKRIVS
jgi:hypothetical protein